ncbi:MAG: hypothetical protein GY854_21240, partial [Deltaproteobacteria bacterium]|nr:hypothetical protein [Deltaproteobacteria bacterium]
MKTNMRWLVYMLVLGLTMLFGSVAQAQDGGSDDGGLVDAAPDGSFDSGPDGDTDTDT